MENNLTNKLNELQNFNLEPSQQVWVEIEKQLPQEKKRRIVAWWWSLPALLFIGLSTWFGFSKEKIKGNVSVTVNNQIKQQNTDILSEKTRIFDKNTPILSENTQVFDKKNYPLDKNTSVLGKNITTSDKIFKSLGKTLAVLNKKEPTFDKNLSIPVENKLPLGKNHSFSDKKELKFSDSNSVIYKNDTDKIVTTLPKKQDSVAAIKSSTKKSLKPTSETKKIFWNLAVASGVNYLSRNSLFSQNISNVYTASSATSGVLPTPQTNSLSLPNTGFNFSLGLNGNYPITKKSKVQFGLHYNYLQNNMALEPVPQTTMNIYAADFRTGNNLVYKNNMHLLSVPVNYVYCFNPLSKTKISLIAGGSIDFAIAKKWLYVNDENNYYQKNDDAINTFFVALNTGVNINFNNKFSVDLLAKKHLTSVQQTSSKYYWQQINMQVNVPLKLKK